MLGSSVDLSCGRPFPISLLVTDVLHFVVVFSKMHLSHSIHDVYEVDRGGIGGGSVRCAGGAKLAAVQCTPSNLVAW